MLVLVSQSITQGRGGGHSFVFLFDVVEARQAQAAGPAPKIATCTSSSGSVFLCCFPSSAQLFIEKMSVCFRLLTPIPSMMLVHFDMPAKTIAPGQVMWALYNVGVGGASCERRSTTPLCCFARRRGQTQQGSRQRRHIRADVCGYCGAVVARVAVRGAKGVPVFGLGLFHKMAREPRKERKGARSARPNHMEARRCA